MSDRSNGYEGVAAEFLASRGRAPQTAIGVRQVGEWARALARGAAVLDLGSGPGIPITRALLDAGLDVFAVDASPSLVAAFRRNFPAVPIACEAAEDSAFFGRKFDAVVAWGLVFLLTPEAQRRLLQNVADALLPGGRLLFTSPAEPVVWKDVMTGLESRSLGAAEYRGLLAAAGVIVKREYEDAGDNHYYEAVKVTRRR